MESGHARWPSCEDRLMMKVRHVLGRNAWLCDAYAFAPGTGFIPRQFCTELLRVHAVMKEVEESAQVIDEMVKQVTEGLLLEAAMAHITGRLRFIGPGSGSLPPSWVALRILVTAWSYQEPTAPGASCVRPCRKAKLFWGGCGPCRRAGGVDGAAAGQAGGGAPAGLAEQHLPARAEQFCGGRGGAGQPGHCRCAVLLSFRRTQASWVLPRVLSVPCRVLSLKRGRTKFNREELGRRFAAGPPCTTCLHGYLLLWY